MLHIFRKKIKLNKLDVLTRINYLRAYVGKNPLKYDPDLSGDRGMGDRPKIYFETMSLPITFDKLLLDYQVIDILSSDVSRVGFSSGSIGSTTYSHIAIGI